MYYRCEESGDGEIGDDVKGEGVTGEGGEGVKGGGVTGEGGEGVKGGGVTGEGGEGVKGEGVTGEGGEGVKGEGVTGEGGEGVKGEGVTGEGGDSVKGEGVTGEDGEGVSGDGEGASEADRDDTTAISAIDETPPTSQESSKVTWQSLEPQWRRFNFDLIPKVRQRSYDMSFTLCVCVCARVQLIYCRGEMVDLITESSCSRYIEFKAVGGIFSYNHNRIEQVTLRDFDNIRLYLAMMHTMSLLCVCVCVSMNKI